MTEPQERVLSILNPAREYDHRGVAMIASQSGFSEGDVREILTGLIDTKLVGGDESGYHVTAAGEAARPYSGVWLGGRCYEIHTPDGMRT